MQVSSWPNSPWSGDHEWWNKNLGSISVTIASFSPLSHRLVVMKTLAHATYTKSIAQYDGQPHIHTHACIGDDHPHLTHSCQNGQWKSVIVVVVLAVILVSQRRFWEKSMRYLSWPSNGSEHSITLYTRVWVSCGSTTWQVWLHTVVQTLLKVQSYSTSQKLSHKCFASGLV